MTALVQQRKSLVLILVKQKEILYNEHLIFVQLGGKMQGFWFFIHF